MPRKKPVRSSRIMRKRKGRLAKSLMLWGILFLLLFGGFLYLLSLPTFSISRVVVMGESSVSPDTLSAMVLEELSLKYLWIIPKANALLYPRAALEKKLLARFPELESVDVSLAGVAALNLSLSSRKPVAEWCRVEGTSECFLMDKEGFIFGTSVGSLYSRIEDHVRAEAVSLGVRVLQEEELGSLLFLFKRFEALGMTAGALEIHAGDERVARLRGGGRVLMRYDGEFSTEIERLEILLSESDLLPQSASKGLGVDYIDLRHGNKIYFKPH